MGGPRPLRPLKDSNLNLRAAARPVDNTQSKDPVVARDISSVMANLSLSTTASVADFRTCTSPSKLPRPSTPTKLPSIMPEPTPRRRSPPKPTRFLTKDHSTEIPWDIDEKAEEAERHQSSLIKTIAESKTAAEDWKRSAKESKKTIAAQEQSRK